MKIVSIDVGIKNLSFCLFEIIDGNIQVLKWNNIDLSEKTELLCCELDGSTICNKPAKFSKNDKCYCLKHSKKHNYIQPSPELSPSFLKRQKLATLHTIANKYKLTWAPTSKKVNLLEIINVFINTNCYTSITTTNAVKVDLVTIGRNIQHKFDEIFAQCISSIDIMIIENQIGPLANKMKMVQGMIAQYFIMKNNNMRIEIISASNKLKDYLQKEKTDYKQRKQLSVKVCLEIVATDDRFKEWKTFVEKYKKKDDLSDCFLQGMWFIKYAI
jgi:hypothetical protein